jgi:hypothetical protein
LPYPFHQDISSDTKNVERGIVIWEISTSIFLFFAKFAAWRYLFQKIKETWKDLQGFIFSFFELKVIKLTTSRPRHFLSCHLQQHLCKTPTTHLVQLPFDAN